MSSAFSEAESESYSSERSLLLCCAKRHVRRSARRTRNCLSPLCYEQVEAHPVAIRAEVQPLPVA